MQRFVDELKRTHMCGDVSQEQINQQVVLMGWVQNRRDHGGCIFIDLRDRSGVMQIMFDPRLDATAHQAAAQLRSEWVLAIQGVVRSRGANENQRLRTGSIEVAAERLHVFASAKTPPFQIEEQIDTAEEVRLKYRYLDLRRPPLQRNLQWRHRFNQVVRNTLDAHGFLELETPFLIKSTPEGARDYVVPSRVNPGQFFALPQSPQLFKQLLMVAGYDRYFQITRCFRDEDLRAERQPEFTQVDLEMSFCSPADVQAVTEDLLVKSFKAVLGIDLQLPFSRMTYHDAMETYGVDAPDLRFGWPLVDLSQLLANCQFQVFADALARGGVIKAINLEGTEDISRKDLDDLTNLVKVYGAKGLAWVKVKEDHTWQSPIAKFLSSQERQQIVQALGLKPGDTAVFVADTLQVARAALGNLRKSYARHRGLIKENTYHFCWITDFPLFEWDAQAQRFFAAHHPFTAPLPEHQDLLLTDPGKVLAQAYDIVLNGVEIGGGSIRIHDSQLQQNMFRALGLSEAEAQKKFGFLLEALQYGAPPHGGLALGVDRILMHMCGTQSIRDVIAFPKTHKQTDLMLEAPSSVDTALLEELHIALMPHKLG